MRWVTRSAGERARERGAAAIIVALLFAGGAAMGALAISVDVGNVMVERRSIQNGADAAAMALAASCAKDENSAACSPSATGPLITLAGANASAGYSNDGVTAVPESGICGHGVAGFTECGLGDYKSDYANLTSCLPATSNVQKAKYVEVRSETETLDPSHPTILPKVFSQMLTGGGPDVTVRACARAAWGAAGGTGTTLPLVAGYCDWKRGTLNGLAPKPPYSPAPNRVSGSSATTLPTNIYRPIPFIAPKFPIALLVHDNTKSEVGKCGASANGQTYPGGFSWALTCGDLRAKDPSLLPAACEGVPDNKCVAAFTADGTALVGSNGAAPANNCKGVGMVSYVGTTVFIPVASGWDNSSKTYQIDGVAAFFLAGVNSIPGGVGTVSAYSEPTEVCNLAAAAISASACNPGTTYIWGWFTSGVVPVNSIQVTDHPKGGSAVVPAG